MQRKKSRELISIGNLVDQFMQTCRQSPDTRMTRVWQIWNLAVGSTIAENAQPAAFKGSLLIVNVNSSPWLQQLQFLKTDIMDKVNAELGAGSVTDIRFKIGSL